MRWLKGFEGVWLVTTMILTIAVIFLIYSIAFAGLQENQGPVTKFDSIISKAAAQYGVEAVLIKAVIQAESSFEPDSVSNTGAKGLMQLTSETIDDLNDGASSMYCKPKGMPEITDPFDPEQNIHAGTCYLSYLLKRFNNDKELALAAYNCGPTAISRAVEAEGASWESIRPSLGKYCDNYEEVMPYVPRVLAYYEDFKSGSITAIG
jgi:soluble lytic murein transglycosylase-like protein